MSKKKPNAEERELMQLVEEAVDVLERRDLVDEEEEDEEDEEDEEEDENYDPDSDPDSKPIDADFADEIPPRRFDTKCRTARPRPRLSRAQQVHFLMDMLRNRRRDLAETRYPFGVGNATEGFDAVEHEDDDSEHVRSELRHTHDPTMSQMVEALATAFRNKAAGTGGPGWMTSLYEEFKSTLREDPNARKAIVEAIQQVIMTTSTLVESRINRAPEAPEREAPTWAQSAEEIERIGPGATSEIQFTPQRRGMFSHVEIQVRVVDEKGKQVKRVAELGNPVGTVIVVTPRAESVICTKPLAGFVPNFARYSGEEDEGKANVAVDEQSIVRFTIFNQSFNTLEICALAFFQEPVKVQGVQEEPGTEPEPESVHMPG